MVDNFEGLGLDAETSSIGPADLGLSPEDFETSEEPVDPGIQVPQKSTLDRLLGSVGLLGAGLGDLGAIKRTGKDPKALENRLRQQIRREALAQRLAVQSKRAQLREQQIAKQNAIAEQQINVQKLRNQTLKKQHEKMFSLKSVQAFGVFDKEGLDNPSSIKSNYNNAFNEGLIATKEIRDAMIKRSEEASELNRQSLINRLKSIVGSDSATDFNALGSRELKNQISDASTEKRIRLTEKIRGEERRKAIAASGVEQRRAIDLRTESAERIADKNNLRVEEVTRMQIEGRFGVARLQAEATLAQIQARGEVNRETIEFKQRFVSEMAREGREHKSEEANLDRELRSQLSKDTIAAQKIEAGLSRKLKKSLAKDARTFQGRESKLTRTLRTELAQKKNEHDIDLVNRKAELAKDANPKTFAAGIARLMSKAESRLLNKDEATTLRTYLRLSAEKNAALISAIAPNRAKAMLADSGEVVDGLEESEVPGLSINRFNDERQKAAGFVKTVEAHIQSGNADRMKDLLDKETQLDPSTGKQIPGREHIKKYFPEGIGQLDAAFRLGLKRKKIAPAGVPSQASFQGPRDPGSFESGRVRRQGGPQIPLSPIPFPK